MHPCSFFFHFPCPHQHIRFFFLQISEIANAFYQSLHMSEDERMRRISIASEFVTRVTTQRWALAVMLDLKGVHKSVNPVQNTGAGLGLGYRLLGMDIGFSSLDFNRAVKAFKSSRSRLILMDYGGTIASNDNVSRIGTSRSFPTWIRSLRSYFCPNHSLAASIHCGSWTT